MERRLTNSPPSSRRETRQRLTSWTTLA